VRPAAETCAATRRR